MKRGDIVIVDYPYSDKGGSKVRPALVVQADAKNNQLTDTIIALITSRLHRLLDTHLVIDIATPAGKRTGLRLQSAVQCENLYTIDQKMVLTTIGKLGADAMRQIDDKLRLALALV